MIYDWGLTQVFLCPYQVQQHSQGKPYMLQILQDLCEGLANE